MWEVIIENAVQIAAALLIALIGTLGAWLAAKVGKNVQLKNTALALEELHGAVQTTVAELQQTTVDKLKSAHEDGRLTDEEIAELGQMLLKQVQEKMSTVALNALNAAGADIVSYIIGKAEAQISNTKSKPKADDQSAALYADTFGTGGQTIIQAT